MTVFDRRLISAEHRCKAAEIGDREGYMLCGESLCSRLRWHFALTHAPEARAQGAADFYASHPITLISSFAAGGCNDLASRPVARARASRRARRRAPGG